MTPDASAEVVNVHRLQVDHQIRFAVTRGAFAAGNPQLAAVMPGIHGRPPRALVVVELAVSQSRPRLLEEIHGWAMRTGCDLVGVDVLAGGEAIKVGLAEVERVAKRCHAAGLDRHSYVIAIGGGAFLDAVGLAAALVHRGLRLVRLPTTTLSQADGGLGVKNAVNAWGAKNLLGTFQPPWAVLNDLDFLDTLDDRGWRDGIAEAVKVAVLKDGDFLRQVHAPAPRLAARDGAAMEVVVRRCATLHLEHILTSGDPFEQGSSRPLDFGHWSAHQLEVDTKHRLSHGEAVAIGVALDLCIAADAGWIATADADLALSTLRRVGFRLYDPAIDQREADGRRRLLVGLEAFREHLGGDLTLAMPDGLGHRQDIHELSLDRLEKGSRRLHRLDQERS